MTESGVQGVSSLREVLIVAGGRKYMVCIEKDGWFIKRIQNTVLLLEPEKYKHFILALS